MDDVRQRFGLEIARLFQLKIDDISLEKYIVRTVTVNCWEICYRIRFPTFGTGSEAKTLTAQRYDPTEYPPNSIQSPLLSTDVLIIDFDGRERNVVLEWQKENSKRPFHRLMDEINIALFLAQKIIENTTQNCCLVCQLKHYSVITAVFCAQNAVIFHPFSLH